MIEFCLFSSNSQGESAVIVNAIMGREAQYIVVIILTLNLVCVVIINSLILRHPLYISVLTRIKKV